MRIIKPTLRVALTLFISILSGVFCTFGQDVATGNGNDVETSGNSSMEDFCGGESNDEGSEYVYTPMLADGKEWVVLHHQAVYPASWSGTIYTFRVVGDDVVDDMPCKRLTVNIEIPNHSCNCLSCRHLRSGADLYVYEKDRKIYAYHNPYEYEHFERKELVTSPGRWDLYMDFSAPVGSVIKEYFKVNDVYFSQIGENLLRTIEINGNPVIEGIGSLELYNVWDQGFVDGEDFPTSGYGYFKLWKCMENGLALLDRTSELSADGSLDFVTSVDEIQQDIIPGESVYYNLQGLPVETPLKGEVYIRNGKKVIL